MTLWCPDTCGCEITIEDDKSSPDYALSVAHLKICKDHARLGHGHRDVLQENQRKNLALDDVIKSALPAFNPDTDRPPTWAFDSDRVLTITLPSNNKLNAQAATALQGDLDVKYGAGKVRVG